MAIYLGIHDGHGAAAALLVDGVLVAAAEEERFTRVKNQAGYPAQAVAEVLALAGVELDDVDGVGVAGRWSAAGFVPGHSHSRDASVERHRSMLAGGAGRTVKERLWAWEAVRRRRRKAQMAARHAAFADRLGRPVELFEHHTCHAAAAYHGSASTADELLVLTADGDGDDLAATVSIGRAGRLERLASVGREDSVGWPYEAVTFLLGMQPVEHEFKVMGLAPYAEDAPPARELATRLRALWELQPDGLTWRRRAGVPPLNRPTATLAELVRGMRFDHVAAGIQLATESLLVEWVAACVATTGIRRLALSGGVFMNVKANGRILALPEVDELFVVPTCNDTSNAMGAAYLAASGDGATCLQPLTTLYLGHAIEDEEVRAAWAALPEAHAERLAIRWPDDPEREVAGLLAAGEVVGRAVGRMEFGARALGNRSLLADPSREDNVRVLNRLVKSRDFWMPFAPAAPAEDSERWVQKPAKPVPVSSPFMMLAFPARPEVADQFIAAQHPFDRTARLQEVDADTNESFHRLLRAFEADTGRSVVLNTSLNVHGWPIVRTAAEAIEVLCRTGLRHLQVGRALISVVGDGT